MAADAPVASIEAREVADERALRQRFPWVYSLLTIAIPIAVLYLFARVLNTLIDQRFVEIVVGSIPPLASCVELAFKSLSDLRGRLALAGPHAFLLVASLTAALFAWGFLFRALFDQQRGERRGMVIAAAVLLGVIAVLIVVGVAGIHVQLMERFPVRSFFSEALPNILLGDGAPGRVQANPASRWITDVILERSWYAAYFGLLAAISVIACVAVLAYRFGGAGWDRPSTLRRQIGALLTLFAVSSILLVASNAAVRAFIDWPIGLVTAPLDPSEECRPPNALTLRAIELLRQAGQGLSTVWGAMCSAILVVTFAPAFVSLLSDIALAARIALPDRDGAGHKPDGSYDAKAESYALRKAWREGNGLTLTVSELVTAITAAAAPLLSSSAVDLGRTLLSLK